MFDRRNLLEEIVRLRTEATRARREVLRLRKALQDIADIYDEDYMAGNLARYALNNGGDQ